MISVRNHLLPLSGNKLAVFSLAFMLLCLSSCELFQQTKKPAEPVPVYQPPVDQPDDPNDPVVTNPSDTTTVIITDPSDIELKESYNVAYLLPFNLPDNRNLSTFGKDTVTESSIIALEFYEGAKLAFEQLEREGINLNVYVYDTQKNQGVVDRIMRSNEFLKMDLVIGPVYNSTLRTAAPFSKQKKLPLISPLSPADQLVEDHPYFIMATPSVNAHCEQTLNHIEKNYKPEQVVFIHQSERKEEGILNHAKKYVDNSQNLDYRISSIPSTFHITKESIRPYLDAATTNVIYVPSVDEVFISSVMRELNKLKEDYSIVLYGMPGWESKANMRYDYMDELNTYMTNNNFENVNHPLYRSFVDEYSFQNHSAPTDYSFKGYDITLTFGRILKAEGKNFINKMINKEHVGLSSNFQFKKRVNNAKIDLIENMAVHVLQFENLELKKSN